MCKKLVGVLHSHHVIPRWLGGVDEDMIQVCPKCHKMVDTKFMSILLNPFGDNGYGDKTCRDIKKGMKE